MGNIKVTVQTQDRMVAINNLSIAIKKLAEALASNVSVSLIDNQFNGGNPAVQIDTAQEVNETQIMEVKHENS